MSIDYRASIDFNGNQLINFEVENLSTLPSAGSKGRLVFRTSDNTLWWDDGSAFNQITTGGGSPDASSTVKGITKLSVNPASPTNPIALGANDTTVIFTTTSLGGDLNGNLPNGNVNKADATTYGISKLSTAPASAGVPIAVGDNDSRMTNSRTPTGSAGGDLNGTYPNPNVNKADATTYGITKLSVAPASAGVPIAYGANDTSVVTTSTSLSGDVTGTVGSNTVATVGGKTASQVATAVNDAHVQNTDTGTTSQTFQLQTGSSGVKVKNNAGVLEARNAADSAYADIKANAGTFGGNVDLGENQLIAVRVENLSALPTAGNKGRLVFRTSDNTIWYDDGSAFQQFASPGAAVTSVTGTAPIASSGGTTPAISIAITAANNGGAVALQATTPGTQQTGHLHISGAGQFGNTGLTASEAVLALNQSSTNATIDATNTSASGSALKAQNSSTTVAPIIGTNSSTGPAIQAVTSSGGIGFTASYSNTGNMAEFRNSGTGKGMLATSTSGNAVDSTATTGKAGAFANTSTTNETLNVTQNSTGKGIVASSTSGNTVDATATTGSAGVFANNGAVATVTATNSGAGIGFTGSTADSGSPGVKGQNTGSGLGLEGYSSSGIAGYLHNGSDNIVLKLQETATQTSDVLQFQNSSGTRQGSIKKSAVADFTKVQISGTDRLNSDGSASLVNVTMNGLIKYTVDTYANRPGSPTTGDVHYATDRHIEYYWDGTRWLSKTLYYVQFDNNSTTIPLSASNTAAYVVDRPAWNYDMYLIDFAFRFRVSTTFDSTHKWTMTLDRVDSSNVQTAISSTIDTFQTGRTAGTFYYETPSTNANLTLNTVVTITNGWQFRTNWTLVSTAGVLTLGPFSLSYRLVG